MDAEQKNGSKEGLEEEASSTSPPIINPKAVVDSTDGKSVEIDLKTSIDDEKDELFDRMEAIEKGTDIEPISSSTNNDKKEKESHQNGDCSSDPELKNDGISSTNQSDIDKMEQIDEDMLLAENGDEVTESGETTKSLKRRLSSDSDNEAQVNKKLHTEELPSSNDTKDGVIEKELAYDEVSGSNDKIESDCEKMDGVACDTSKDVTNGEKEKDETKIDDKIDGNRVELGEEKMETKDDDEEVAVKIVEEKEDNKMDAPISEDMKNDTEEEMTKIENVDIDAVKESVENPEESEQSEKNDEKKTDNVEETKIENEAEKIEELETKEVEPKVLVEKETVEKEPQIDPEVDEICKIDEVEPPAIAGSKEETDSTPPAEKMEAEESEAIESPKETEEKEKTEIVNEESPEPDDKKDEKNIDKEASSEISSVEEAKETLPSVDESKTELEETNEPVEKMETEVEPKNQQEEIVGELKVDEPKIVESKVDEPIVVESKVDEPIVVESKVNEPMVDEPTPDEPKVHELVPEKEEPMETETVEKEATPIIEDIKKGDPIVEESKKEEMVEKIDEAEEKKEAENVESNNGHHVKEDEIKMKEVDTLTKAETPDIECTDNAENKASVELEEKVAKEDDSTKCNVEETKPEDSKIDTEKSEPEEKEKVSEDTQPEEPATIKEDTEKSDVEAVDKAQTNASEDVKPTEKIKHDIVAPVEETPAEQVDSVSKKPELETVTEEKPQESTKTVLEPEKQEEVKDKPEIKITPVSEPEEAMDVDEDEFATEKKEIVADDKKEVVTDSEAEYKGKEPVVEPPCIKITVSALSAKSPQRTVEEELEMMEVDSKSKNTDTVADVVKEESANVTEKAQIKLNDSIDSIKPTSLAEKVTEKLEQTQKTVFNSTPITKQFEISSENVSKIVESADNSSSHMESINEVSSSAEKTDDMKNEKLNGISSSSVDGGGQVIDSGSEKLSNVNLGQALKSAAESNFKVDICFQGQDLRYLSIENVNLQTTKVESTSGEETDVSKSNASGSVTSLGPFQTSSMKFSSSSSSDSSANQTKDELPGASKTNVLVKGTLSLCDLMISEFKKIKAVYEPERSEDNDMEDAKTPKSRRGKTSKRPLSKILDSNDEGPAAKQVKRAPKPGSSNNSRSSTPVQVTAEEIALFDKIDQCCLARWTDRKYYAGRIVEAKSDTKFVIHFDDGMKKTLNKDLIIFGDNDTLPILDHAVHVQTSGETYEPGLVTSISRNEDDDVIYTVIADSGTFDRMASGIYLEEDQAKYIFKTLNDMKDKELMQSPADPKKQPVGETEIDTPTTKGGRSTRGKKEVKQPTTPATPEAGFSGGVGKKGRRSRGPPPQVQQTISESSDISDTQEEESGPNSPDSGLEAIDGVQPELQRTAKESEIKIEEYIGNDKSKNLEDIIGPIPSSKTLFKSKHFILTCTIPVKQKTSPNKQNDKEDMKNKFHKFTSLPFVKEQLKNQIEAGGGKVYNHFEDIPKNKQKQCKLIAPHPCVTAKYVQGLAVDMQPISHEWIIDCCRQSKSLDFKNYLLPSGWSLIEEQYIKMNVGRSADQRASVHPFKDTNVMIGSQHKDFTDFWSRVCKMAGATIRIIKTQSDITQNLSGYMLTDQDFPEEIKLKATQVKLPVVSTVWVVQSLIVGKICPPDSHEKLTQIYQDDDY